MAEMTAGRIPQRFTVAVLHNYMLLVRLVRLLPIAGGSRREGVLHLSVGRPPSHAPSQLAVR